MRKSTVVLIVLTMFACPPLQAQEFAVPNSKNAQLLKTVKLAVVIKEGLVKREQNILKYELEPKEYQAQWDMFNAEIESIVRKEWKYSPDIVVIKEEEAIKLKDAKDKGFALLEMSFNSVKTSQTAPRFSGYTPQLSISLAQDSNDPVVAVDVSGKKLTPGMLTFLVRQCQVQLEDCLAKSINYFGERKKEVATWNKDVLGKTIVVYKEWAEERLLEIIEKDSWKEKLCFSLRVVDADGLELALLKGDGQELVYMKLNVGGGGRHDCFINPATGRLLYIDGGSYRYQDGVFYRASEVIAKNKLK